MVGVKVEHILMFVIIAFLLYHLVGRCSCANGVVDGFSVGAMEQCKGTKVDKCTGAAWPWDDPCNNYTYDSNLERCNNCYSSVGTGGSCESATGSHQCSCPSPPSPQPPPSPPPPPVVDHCSQLTNKDDCKKSQPKGFRDWCFWGGDQDFGRRSYNAPEVCFNNSCRYKLRDLKCANATNVPGGTPEASDKNCNLCAGENQEVLRSAGCGEKDITDYCDSSE